MPAPIIFLEEAENGSARASSIAEAAGVTRPTVTSALRTLKSMGMVEYSPYSPIRLTEKGRAIGRDISHRHLIFREFFRSILLIEGDEAEKTACELEHIVPESIIRRLGQFVLHMQSRGLPGNWLEEYMSNRDAILSRRIGTAAASPADRKYS